ncbi:unnamed protein product [Rhizoctonia solani]|uniref:Uncharacterized protein n=1 Tax=Rhizoctonia solani TaxID=456999 RepID=A0A8H3D4D0_9AGAM|nr:unnamed protein product [Rhizoctonia solani]
MRSKLRIIYKYMWATCETATNRALSLFDIQHSTSTTLAQLTSYTFTILLCALRCAQNLYKTLVAWLQTYQSSPPASGTLVFDQRLPALTLLPMLPIEIIEKIADYLFQPIPLASDPSGATSTRCKKRPWRDVSGFMWTSPSLHRMGYRRWIQAISVKNVDDWKVILEHIKLVRYCGHKSAPNLVDATVANLQTLFREIHCFDGTLLDLSHQHTLSKMPNLRTATIDAHGDVWHDEFNRFAYRDILSALPSSLKRLEIEHAHGPDINIISLVKKYCPKLEELRLGRCTMFNRSPACDFWQSFPHDHDAYMSNIGTDSYAHSLGNELAPLKHLRSLQVGLYFVPPDIVLAHRLYHQRGLPAPETIHWQSAIPLADLPTNPLLQELPPHIEPATTTQLVELLHRRDEESPVEFKCQRCIETAGASGSEAEQTANSILCEYLPELVSVEWMGWLTPQHLGTNSYRLSPRRH